MTLILLGVMIVGQVYFYEDPDEEEEDTGGLTRYFDSRTKMNTPVAITFYTGNETLADVAMEAAYARIDFINDIATRFDNGGMRWIRERSEALLQLRCIEINGDWEAFISFVQGKLAAKTMEELERQTLLTTEESPLPTFGLTSCKATT